MASTGNVVLFRGINVVRCRGQWYTVETATTASRGRHRTSKVECWASTWKTLGSTPIDFGNLGNRPVLSPRLAATGVRVPQGCGPAKGFGVAYEEGLMSKNRCAVGCCQSKMAVSCDFM